MKHLGLLPLAALLVSCGGGVTPGPGPQPGDNLQSEQERKAVALLEKFDRFDDNGNGELTRPEIVNGIRFEGIHGVDHAEIDRLFSTCDSNRNGAISLPEANAALSAMRR
jgi:Ca2+-binding EF-hand superfamily protein